MASQSTNSGEFGDDLVSVKIASKVAKTLGEDWAFLGRMMGIEEDTLTEIETTNQSRGPKEMGYKIIELWKKRMSEKATVKALAAYLTDLDCKDLAEEIFPMANTNSPQTKISQAANNQPSSSQQSGDNREGSRNLSIKASGPSCQAAKDISNNQRSAGHDYIEAPAAPKKLDTHSIHNHGKVHVEGSQGHLQGDLRIGHTGGSKP